MTLNLTNKMNLCTKNALLFAFGIDFGGNYINSVICVA